jgi:hypothetical protein
MGEKIKSSGLGRGVKPEEKTKTRVNFPFSPSFFYWSLAKGGHLWQIDL